MEGVPRPCKGGGLGRRGRTAVPTYTPSTPKKSRGVGGRKEKTENRQGQDDHVKRKGPMNHGPHPIKGTGRLPESRKKEQGPITSEKNRPVHQVQKRKKKVGVKEESERVKKSEM